MTPPGATRACRGMGGGYVQRVDWSILDPSRFLVYLVMDNAYEEAAAALAGKHPDAIAMVPKYARVLSKEVLAGRLKKAGLQAHHTVPRYLLRMLGITSDAGQDEAPALLI